MRVVQKSYTFAVVSAVALPVLAQQKSWLASENHVAASWDFEDSLEGWAASSWEEIGAELKLQGGELHGHIMQSRRAPRMDSPALGFNANDDYVVAIRIKLGGVIPQHGAVTVRLQNADSGEQSYGDFTGTSHSLLTVPFDRQVPADGDFHIVYAHLYEYFSGRIAQIRILPVSKTLELIDPKTMWSSFSIDWIRIVKKPTIEKVEGCINKYFSFSPRPESNDLEQRIEDTEYMFRGGVDGGYNNWHEAAVASNDDLHLAHHTTPAQSDETFRYATTYNCPRQQENMRIRISGRNFGSYDVGDTNHNIVWNTVTVGGLPCKDVIVLVPQTALECTLPTLEMSKTGVDVDRVAVVVRQPEFRGLSDHKYFLSYSVPPPKLDPPLIANIGSHALDLSWSPPSNMWDAVATTGYMIYVYQFLDDGFYHAPVSKPKVSDFEDPSVFGQVTAFVVGNVTTTTITELKRGRKYRFALSAIAEDQANELWKQVDLYGHRHATEEAQIGVASMQTDTVSLLGHDIEFLSFDANQTLDHGAVDPRSIVGPSQNEHGEGHFGLVLVGNANLENCNAAQSCCDYRDGACEIICSAIRNDADSPTEYLNFESSLQPLSNQGHGIYIGAPRPGFEDDTTGFAACGSALRLTESQARKSGAAWYPRKMNVREGFETSFTFRLSNPSFVCKFMDDVDTKCRSRGADGLAFVLQTDDPRALGGTGSMLGYGGIKDALAVEFDTFYNPELKDPYENHIAVITKGTRGEATLSSHDFQLGLSTSGPDLTQGELNVKIIYEPRLHRDALFSDSFSLRPHANRLMSSWTSGVGLLSVYVNDMGRPLFTTVLNLNEVIKLDRGRAWVGFTASTGESFWQTHDILAWQFDATRTNGVP